MMDGFQEQEAIRRRAKRRHDDLVRQSLWNLIVVEYSNLSEDIKLIAGSGDLLGTFSAAQAEALAENLLRAARISHEYRDVCHRCVENERDMASNQTKSDAH